MRTSRFITRLHHEPSDSSSVALPPELLEALGVETGAELVVEIVGSVVILCSIDEARRSRDFMNTFQSILSRRRDAYEELAENSD